MIKIHSLMPGCTVWVPGKIVATVKRIDLETGEIFVRSGNVLGKSYKQDDLYGIPLEEDDLIRMGFEKKEMFDGKIITWEKFDKAKTSHMVISDCSNSGKPWSIHFDNDHFESIGSGEFEYLHELEILHTIMTNQPIFPNTL